MLLKGKVRKFWDRVKRMKRRTLFFIGTALAVLIILILLIIPSSFDVATAEVLQGEFIVDLVTRGEIDALNSTNISIPRMRRRMSLQIVDMAEEGTNVKKGDFLLQLDTSEAQQRVDEHADELENAKAQLESEKATIASNMAQLESQLESEKYSYEQAELSLKMMQFEAEAKKQEYELNKKKAEVALAQAKEKIESQKVIDKATLLKAELAVRQAELELKETEQALDQLTMRAPIDGLVVYKEIWSGSGLKKVQIGDSPWPGMPIVGIPDLSVMQSKTTVNEVDISRVERGQNAIITVDALEGATYYGSITRLATLARREEATNVKVFDVEVTIDSTDGRLRPGMTCDIRLITGRLENALHVPLQSVFQKEGKTVVYVAGTGMPRMREVTIGEKSSDRIVIEEGLEPGENVCLRDPTRPLEDLGGEGESTTTAKPKSTPTSRPRRPSGRMVIIG